jgi:hypothetical protein
LTAKYYGCIFIIDSQTKVGLSIKIKKGGEKICQDLMEQALWVKVQELVEVSALAGAG